MVRTISSNPFSAAEFLERIRPGIAISVLLHTGLFILLAYILAFHAPMPVPAAPDDPVFRYIDPPKPPQKPQPPVHSNFHPDPTPHLPGVVTDVPPLPLPPDQNFDRHPTGTENAALASQPPVIINPKPIYQGGLVYPERAAAADRQGYVDFDFIIEPDGTVGDPVVVAEVPDGYGFAAAAKKAFPKWRFKPQLVDGKPVAAAAHIRVTFKLS
jgi:protein TonB